MAGGHIDAHERRTACAEGGTEIEKGSRRRERRRYRAWRASQSQEPAPEAQGGSQCVDEVSGQLQQLEHLKL